MQLTNLENRRRSIAGSPVTTAPLPTRSPPQRPPHAPADSNQWAVIFKYSSVNIPSGVTVTFKNHPSHAPVVWLVSGAVTNNGRLSVDGAAATGVGPAEGGPGGFRGCLPPVAGVTIGSAGFGPGGGNYTDGAGSFGSLGGGNAGPIYGNNRLIPLVGGSGGAPRSVNYVTCHDWTAGGAILVAAANRIQLNGQISAYGGEPTDGCFARGAGGSGPS